MKRIVEDDIRRMYKEIRDDAGVIIDQKIVNELPAPLQKYIGLTCKNLNEKISSVRLKQEGMFRTGINAGWMPYSAEQYFRIDMPAFTWFAKMKGPLGFKFYSLDNLIEGKGKMMVKIANLFTITEAEGAEITQAVLVRYLAEMIWFPAAFASRYITWESQSDLSVKAVLKCWNLEVSGIFNFEPDGRISSFEAKRNKPAGKYYFPEDWSVVITEYRKFRDLYLPAACEATWKLNIGELTYIKIMLTAVEYNRPVKFS